MCDKMQSVENSCTHTAVRRGVKNPEEENEKIYSMFLRFKLINILKTKMKTKPIFSLVFLGKYIQNMQTLEREKKKKTGKWICFFEFSTSTRQLKLNLLSALF